MAADNSGPAFPHPGGASDYTVQVSHMGMSLREWFAGRAMQALVANNVRPRDSYETMAKGAYAMADAMIAERGK